jgi:hypothetical protein
MIRLVANMQKVLDLSDPYLQYEAKVAKLEEEKREKESKHCKTMLELHAKERAELAAKLDVEAMGRAKDLADKKQALELEERAKANERAALRAAKEQELELVERARAKDLAAKKEALELEAKRQDKELEYLRAKKELAAPISDALQPQPQPEPKTIPTEEELMIKDNKGPVYTVRGICLETQPNLKLEVIKQVGMVAYNRMTSRGKIQGPFNYPVHAYKAEDVPKIKGILQETLRDMLNGRGIVTRADGQVVHTSAQPIEGFLLA